MRRPLGSRIPFQFATPPDSHPTDESDPNNRWLWRLSVSAELSGVDYAAAFELPVFPTGETVDGSEFVAFEQKYRAAAARIHLKPASGVVTNRLANGGEKFVIRATTLAGTVPGPFFLALWNAVLAIQIYVRAPLTFMLLFGAADLLMIAPTLDTLLGRSTIEVDGNGVRVHRQWLGVGIAKPKSWDSESIVSIDGTAVTASGPFGVMLKLRDGGTKVIGSKLSDRRSADAVAARMMADLGRM